VRRVQATSAETGPSTTTGPPAPPIVPVGGQSLSLQAALYGSLTSNPDLVTLRQGVLNTPSPEAVEVARLFPTTLNPTIWIDYRPITLIPRDTFGSGSTAGGGSSSSSSSGATSGGHHGFYHSGQNFFYISLRQPVELGHQTTHRHAIAQAAFTQQRWNIVQAELTALVQTYRLFQTAAYRREKHALAGRLADFNDRMLATLQRQLEASQGQAADLVLARVEARAARQQVTAARQDYLTAQADLRNQVGLPATAGGAQPLGEFILPATIPAVDEEAMVRLALENRPDIQAARAGAVAAQAAVRLARGDRIPSPIIGPEYQIDEAGVQYVGLILVSPFPVLNPGKAMVRQREAEAHRAAVVVGQAEQRAVSQVRAAAARWNGATALMAETGDLAGQLAREVGRLERLFEAGQVDVARLMQARQRQMQLENARLDAIWQAALAQSDLLAALGAPFLISAMLNQAEAAAGVSPPAVAPTPTPPPATAAP
jgi:cobalt-zinc-cadmium efflux system outer membrane protein